MVLVAIYYSVLVARNGYIRNVVVACQKSFICSGCLNPLTSAGRSSVNIGASAKLECRVWYCLRDPMSSRFSKTPTCDRQTDGHRAMASNAGA